MGNWLHQQGRGLSRWLNGFFGTSGMPETGAGDGAVTFSAASFGLAQAGSRWGRWRVAFVDALPGNGPGHCAAAAAWHRMRGLIPASAQLEEVVLAHDVVCLGQPKGS